MIVPVNGLLAIYKYLFAKVNDYTPAYGSGVLHICTVTAV